MLIPAYSLEGGIQIDEMDPISTGGLPLQSHGHGIRAIHGLLGGFTSFKTNDLTTHDVNCGIEEHEKRDLRARGWE